MIITSRERILSVLNHEKPDRVPIILGVSNATGIKMRTYQGIKKLVGVDAPDEYIYEWLELGTAKIDERTMRRLHSDVRGVRDLEPKSVRECNHNRPPQSDCIDSWGSGQIRVGEEEWYPGIHQFL